MVRRSHTPSLSFASAVVALAAVMLVVPASASLCASDLGVCAMPEAPAPETAHCPLAAGHGAPSEHGHGSAHDQAPDMDCCVTDAAPHGPVPAVPSPAKNADTERQLQPLPALAPADVVLGSPAAPAPVPAVSPPAADLAASHVPLYTLLSSLLS